MKVKDLGGRGGNMSQPTLHGAFDGAWGGVSGAAHQWE